MQALEAKTIVQIWQPAAAPGPAGGEPFAALEAQGWSCRRLDDLATAEPAQPVLADLQAEDTGAHWAALEAYCQQAGGPLVVHCAPAQMADLQPLACQYPTLQCVPAPAGVEALTSLLTIARCRWEQAQARQHKERWLRATLNSLGEAVLSLNTSGVLLAINPAAEQLLGVSEAAAAGQRVDALFQLAKPGAERLMRWPELQHELPNWHAYLRMELAQQQNTPRYVEANMQPVGHDGGANGQAEAEYVLVLREVTSVVQREQRLRRLARRISGQLGEGFFYTLVQSLVEVLDLRGARMSLWKSEQGVVEDLAVFADGAFGTNYTYAPEGTLYELMLRGEYLWQNDENAPELPQDAWLQAIAPATVMGLPLKDQAGNLLGFLQIAVQSYRQDRELLQPLAGMLARHAAAELQRLQAERERKRREYEYQLIFHQAPALIMFMDRNGKILRGNPATTRFLERGEGILRNVRHFEGMGELDRAMQEQDQAVLASGEPLRGDIQQVPVNGQTKWVMQDKVPWTDYLSGEQGILVVASDITEQIRAKQALQEQQQELEQTVAERTREYLETNRLLREEVKRREQAQAELAHSEARYRGIVEDQTQLILRATPDMQFTFANQAYLNFRGLAETDLLNMNAHELWSSVHRQQAYEALQRIDAENPVTTFEAAYPQEDGSLVWLQWTVRALFDQAGALIEYQGVGNDITAYKQLQEALQQEAERNKMLFDSSRDGLLILEDFVFVDCNEAALALYGCETQDELLGYTPYDFSPEYQANGERSVEAAERELARCKAEGKSLFEWIHTRQNGRRFDAEVLLSHFTYRGKSMVQVAVRDITERKQREKEIQEQNRALQNRDRVLRKNLEELRHTQEDMRRIQEQLQQSEQRYRAVVEDQTDVILRADPAGRLTFANRPYASFYNTTPDELIGLDVRSLWPEHVQEQIQAVQQLITPEQPYQNRELYYSGEPDGTPRWILWTITGLFDQEGQLQEYQGVGREITAYKQMQRALQDREQRYRTLIEGVYLGILLIDPAGKILLVNQTAEEALQMARQTLHRQPITCLQDRLTNRQGEPLPIEDFERVISQAPQGMPHHEIVGYRAAAEEPLKWFLVDATPQFNSEAALDFVIVSFLDITSRVEAETELEKAHSQLQQVYLELEERVKLRTKELSAANDHLVQEVNNRKKVEEALRESEALYRSTVNVMEEGVIIAGTDGRVISANNSASRMLGYAATPFEGQHLAECFANACFATGEPMGYEEHLMMLPLRSGESVVGEVMGIQNGQEELRWLRVNAQPLQDERTGENAGLVATFSDFTEKFRAEEALRRSHELLDAVFRYSNDGLLILDADSGLVKRCNRRAAELFDYNRPEALLGRSLSRRILTCLDVNGEPAESNNLFRKKDWFGEIKFRTIYKRHFWANVSITGISMQEQTLRYVRITNINEQREAEHQMRQLQMAINYAHDAVIITDSGSRSRLPRVLYVNPAFREIIGQGAHQIIGESVGTIHVLQNDPAAREQLWYAQRTGQAQTFEVNTKTEEGHMLIADLYISPVRDANQHLINWVIVLRDITEKRRIEYQITQQRMERQNAITQAVIDTQEQERSRIAEELHDSLGHNLSVLKMNFSVLAGKLAESDAKTQELTQSTRQLLDETTNEIRNISRNLTPSLLYDFGLIKALRSMCKRTEQGNALSVNFYSFEIEERLPQDIEITFYRVVQELLNNTLKYAKADEVNVQLLWQEGQLVLVYEDNGQGFDLESVQASGRGLGLKNIDARVRMINGTMDIDTSPYHGTTVVLEVPHQPAYDDHGASAVPTSSQQ
jgi:PAS domain S-box-containing protein